jgi:Zn-dependent alcohol dehydrogenase
LSILRDCMVDMQLTSIAEFVNPKDLPEGKNIVDYLVEQTDGGLDFTFDATGNVSSPLAMRAVADLAGDGHAPGT